MKDISRFIVTILVIVVSLLIVDKIVGKVVGIAYQKLDESGYQLPLVYRNIEKATGDVVVLGASKACHHYVPSIMADSLKMSVVNAGELGTGSTYSLCVLHGILNRYEPKLVVLDYTPRLLNGIYQGKDASSLRFFASDDFIMNHLIDLEGGSIKYKLWCNMYRVHEGIGPLLSAILSKEKVNDGYVPLSKPAIYPTSAPDDTPVEINPVELKSLKEIFNLCKEREIRLVVVDSPSLLESKIQEEQLEKICKESNVTFLNNSVLTEFSDSTNYHDASHMHDAAARSYTTFFVRQIKTNNLQESK